MWNTEGVFQLSQGSFFFHFIKNIIRVACGGYQEIVGSGFQEDAETFLKKMFLFEDVRILGDKRAGVKVRGGLG